MPSATQDALNLQDARTLGAESTPCQDAVPVGQEEETLSFQPAKRSGNLFGLEQGAMPLPAAYAERFQFSSVAGIFTVLTGLSVALQLC